MRTLQMGRTSLKVMSWKAWKCYQWRQVWVNIPIHPDPLLSYCQTERLVEYLLVLEVNMLCKMVRVDSTGWVVVCRGGGVDHHGCWMLLVWRLFFHGYHQWSLCFLKQWLLHYHARVYSAIPVLIFISALFTQITWPDCSTHMLNSAGSRNSMETILIV